MVPAYEYSFASLGMLVGLALGVTGAGGAILLVPLLVYGLGVPAERAAGQSAAVLGVVGAAGALGSLRDGSLVAREFLWYLPGVVLGAYTGRAWIVEWLPPSLAAFGREWPRGAYLMLALAAVMLAAAAAMLRPVAGEGRERGAWVGMAAGLLVGLLTGVLGAGGGFLLVPALVMASRLEPAKAAGTSLGLVAAGTLVAGATELASHAADVRWPSFLALAAWTGLGMAAGLALRRRTPQSGLRAGMAGLIALVAFGIVLREVLPRLGP